MMEVRSTMQSKYTPLPVAAKRCTTCGEHKPLSAFYRVQSDGPRLRSRCKPCIQASQQTDPVTFKWRSLALDLRKRPAGGKAPTATALRSALGEPYRCGLCGGALSWEVAALDHLLPLSRGGTHAIENLCWMHRVCNTAKGGLTIEEFCTLAGRVLAFRR